MKAFAFGAFGDYTVEFRTFGRVTARFGGVKLRVLVWLMRARCLHSLEVARIACRFQDSGVRTAGSWVWDVGLEDQERWCVDLGFRTGLGFSD